MDTTLNPRFRRLVVAVLTLVVTSPTIARNFHWNWREAKYLTAEQSLRTADVTNAERESLASAFANQLRPFMVDLDLASDEQLHDAALETRIEKLDLNGDGSAEVLAQGEPGCSPTGNCPFWVFQRTRNRYKLILDGFGQTFTIQHARTNGYLDIVIAMHGSATESTLKIYRYERGRYRRVDCMEAAWSVLEGEAVRELKEPRITPCGRP